MGNNLSSRIFSMGKESWTLNCSYHLVICAATEESSMRNAVIFGLLLFAIPAAAKDLRWEEATLAGGASSVSEAAIVTIPVGVNTVSGPLRIRSMYYRFETPTMTYIVGQLCAHGAAQSKYKCPLNVAIHAKTQIAVDGRNVHIRDDDGKDIKLSLVEKILRQTAAEKP
jgi:hypothetical protein